MMLFLMPSKKTLSLEKKIMPSLATQMEEAVITPSRFMAAEIK